MGRVAERFLNGNELIEHPYVKQEQHSVVVWRILNGKEPFGGVVGLHVTHTPLIGDVAVLLTVRLKGYASMEKHLQILPQFMDVVHSRLRNNLFQHSQKPGRDTRYIGYILAHRRLHKSRKFKLPVSHESHLFRGHPHEIHERIYVLYKICREIAHRNSCGQRQLIGETSAEDEAFAVEDAAVRIGGKIKRHHIGSAGIMVLAE